MYPCCAAVEGESGELADKPYVIRLAPGEEKILRYSVEQPVILKPLPCPQRAVDAGMAAHTEQQLSLGGCAPKGLPCGTRTAGAGCA